jgi:hypothetical protein
MPEPNRPTWRIVDGLGDQPVRRLTADGVTVRLECEACHHKADWSPVDLDRLFGKSPTRTLDAVGHRLRCGSCGSTWLRICRV